MSFNPKSMSLKWHILTSSLQFEKHHISPSFEPRITKIISSNVYFSIFIYRLCKTFSKNILYNIFIYTEKYIGSHKNIKIIIHNTEHTKHTQIHFQQSKFSFFKKYISFGLPGSLRTAFELNKLICPHERYARCDYTNATCH